MKQLLLILGILSCLPTLAQDFQYTYKDKTLTYSILRSENREERTCKVKDYASMSSMMLGELILPDSVLYNGNWYTLKSIGIMSFANCTGLKSIEISNSVETIEQGAFRECNSVMSLQIGNSVNTIENGAFFGCSALRALEIPNSVRTIDDHAFYGCSGLLSLLIGNSVYTLGNEAFGDCDSHLVKYAYPSHIQNDPVPKGYFSYPYAVKYDSGSSVIEKGCVYDKNKEQILFAPITLGEDYQIPSTVKTIEKNAFKGCSGLKSVEIPNSVEIIKDYAFDHCDGIISLKLGNSLKTIGKYTFYFCTGLTSVEIPNSVETIQDNAFHTCTKLTSVIIGTSIKNMGSTVFGITGIVKCAYPNTISYPFDGSEASYVVCYDPEGAVIENGWIYGPNKESIYYVPYTLKGDYHIPNSINSIGNDAFSGCSEITSIEIPNSVHTIGNGAFYNCTGMKSLIIGNSVKTIGRSAFNNCSALTSVELPNSVETIGDLTCYEYSVTDFFKFNTMGAFSNCSALTSIVIPNSVRTIGNCAFSNCTGLESLHIGNSVKTIGIGAFSNCVALKSVEIPNSVESIGLTTLHENKEMNDFIITNLRYKTEIGAFSNCSALTEVEIPNSVYSLGLYAFSNCTGLKSLQIGNSVKTIGQNAFNDCSSLESVQIPNSVETIGAYAFAGCSALQSAVLGDSIKSIEEGVFSNCTSLTSVNIPNSVETIEANAFSYCIGITSFYFGNSVKSIGKGAFWHCSSLPKVELPCSIEAIEYIAFSGCESLSCLVCNTIIPPYINNNSFDEVTYETCLLKVPETAKEIYKEHTVWRKFSIEGIKIAVQSIELVPNKWEGEVGSTFMLSATIKPTNATDKSLVWISSDASIATVDREGIITTKKAGSVIITATALDGSGISASCIVDVNNIPISEVALNTYLVELLTDETFQLVATVTPENATNKSLEWSSSDEAVATVNGNGLITARSAGNAVIVATVADSYSVHDTFCRVIVKDTNSIMDTVNDNGVSVKSEASQIIINGVATGCPITVYDFDGYVYHTEIATGPVCINVIAGQPYIIKIDTRTFKIIAK